MKNKPNFRSNAGIRAAALLAMMWFATSANAVPIACDASYALKVTGDPSGTNAGCQVGTANNDSQAQVNTDALFGFSDWLFAQRDNGLNGTDLTTLDLGLALTGNVLGGTWALAAGVWDDYEDIMLVFKSGNGGPISPNDHVAYLLVRDDISGRYVSPFINLNITNGNNLTGSSHVSAYVRGDGREPQCRENCDVPVPEPTSLALIGLALAGLGGRRYRRIR